MYIVSIIEDEAGHVSNNARVPSCALDIFIAYLLQSAV